MKSSTELTFGVVSLGPVVAGSGLTKDEVVGSEDLSKRPRSDRVHGAGFQVHEDGAGHVLATGGLIVVHVDTLQLEIAVPMVST